MVLRGDDHVQFYSWGSMGSHSDFRHAFEPFHSFHCSDRLSFSNAFPIDGGKWLLSHIVHYQWSGQMAPKGIDNTKVVINNPDQAEHLITGQFRVVTSRAGIDPS